MGCCLQSSNKNYFEYKYSEENEIRRWEKEGSFYTVDFNTIIQSCIVSNKYYPIRLIDNLVTKLFGKTVQSIVNNNYFKIEEKGKEYYDANKINLLFFLITSHSYVSNRVMSYIDKANYMILIVNHHQEDEMMRPFEKNTHSLIDFVEELCRISCLYIAGKESFHKNRGIL